MSEEGQSPVKMTSNNTEGKFGQRPVSTMVKKGMTGQGTKSPNWNNIVPIGGGGTAVVGPEQTIAQHPAKVSHPTSNQKSPGEVRCRFCLCGGAGERIAFAFSVCHCPCHWNSNKEQEAKLLKAFDHYYRHRNKMEAQQGRKE